MEFQEFFKHQCEQHVIDKSVIIFLLKWRCPLLVLDFIYLLDIYFDDDDDDDNDDDDDDDYDDVDDNL